MLFCELVRDRLGLFLCVDLGLRGSKTGQEVQVAYSRDHRQSLESEVTHDLPISHSACPSSRVRFHFCAQNRSSTRWVPLPSSSRRHAEASIISIPLKQGLNQAPCQIPGTPLMHKETGHSWCTLSVPVQLTRTELIALIIS